MKLTVGMDVYVTLDLTPEEVEKILGQRDDGALINITNTALRDGRYEVHFFDSLTACGYDELRVPGGFIEDFNQQYGTNYDENDF